MANVFNGSLSDMSNTQSNALLALTVVTFVFLVVGLVVLILMLRRAIALKTATDDIESAVVKRPFSVSSEDSISSTEKPSGGVFIPTPGSFLASVTLNPSSPPPKTHPLLSRFKRSNASANDKPRTSRRRLPRISQMSKNQLQCMPGYEGGFRAALLKMTKKSLRMGQSTPMSAPRPPPTPLPPSPLRS